MGAGPRKRQRRGAASSPGGRSAITPATRSAASRAQQTAFMVARFGRLRLQAGAGSREWRIGSELAPKTGAQAIPLEHPSLDAPRGTLQLMSSFCAKFAQRMLHSRPLAGIRSRGANSLAPAPTLALGTSCQHCRWVAGAQLGALLLHRGQPDLSDLFPPPSSCPLPACRRLHHEGSCRAAGSPAAGHQVRDALRRRAGWPARWPAARCKAPWPCMHAAMHANQA